MRASTILFTLLATLAAAAPGQQATADVSPILQKRCERAGVCSIGGDNGTFCANLDCCSKSKSGRGKAVCCCN